MASPSTVLTHGFGSWGSVNLLPTLGYGIGAEAAFNKVCFCSEAFGIPEFASERYINPEFSDEETIIPQFSSESFLDCNC